MSSEVLARELGETTQAVNADGYHGGHGGHAGHGGHGGPKMTSSSSSSSSPNLSLKTRLLCSTYGFLLDWIFRSNLAFLGPLLDIKLPAYSSAGVASSDVYFDHSHNLWLRLYTPSTTTKLPLLVYFHGGGFASLSASSMFYDGFCRRLAAALPAVVASINYRLAPTHKFPAQHHDGLAALSFLTGSPPQNADLHRCFLAGDSAGGNIAHHVALKACNGGSLTIRGIISVQPFFGGEERVDSEIRNVEDPILNVGRTDWMWRTWLPAGSGRDHPAVNVSGPHGEDISGREFPPTVVFTGGFDPLLDWQRRYAQWLRRSGKEVRLVEYPAGIHGFCVFPDMPESGFLIDEIKKFVIHKSI